MHDIQQVQPSFRFDLFIVHDRDPRDVATSRMAYSKNDRVKQRIILTTMLHDVTNQWNQSASSYYFKREVSSWFPLEIRGSRLEENMGTIRDDAFVCANN